MYTAKQLSAFIRSDKQQFLYLDATSSLVQKLPNNNNVFLYSLVWKNPIPGNIAIPVAEMLSTDQHSREIRHFLSSVCDSAREQGLLFKPRKIESDFYFAILQSVSSAFNGCDLRSYVTFCWNVQSGRLSSKEVNHKTVIHTCVAHCIKMFSQKLSNHVNSLKLRKFILYCLGHLLNMTDYDDVRNLFKQLCVVLGSQRMDKQVSETLNLLKYNLSKDIGACKNEFQEEADEQTDLELFGALRRSEFYTDCLAMYDKRRVPEETAPIHGYYAGEFLQVFLNTYTGLIPLWTGIMLRHLQIKKSKKEENNNDKVNSEYLTRDSTSLFRKFEGMSIHVTTL